MSKKSRIILVSLILCTFCIVMGVVIYINTRPVETEETDPTKHNYAVNETKDIEDEDDEIEEPTITDTVVIDKKVISHLDRLTPEQYAAKTDFYDKLHDRVKQDETENKTVVTEEISEATNEFDVFVYVTFSDGTSATYVCGYDPTMHHSFLRCSSLEEYEYYNSEENCG